VQQAFPVRFHLLHHTNCIVVFVDKDHLLHIK
jgi:hypothetical protein